MSEGGKKLFCIGQVTENTIRCHCGGRIFGTPLNNVVQCSSCENRYKIVPITVETVLRLLKEKKAKE